MTPYPELEKYVTDLVQQERRRQFRRPINWLYWIGLLAVLVIDFASKGNTLSRWLFFILIVVSAYGNAFDHKKRRTNSFTTTHADAVYFSAQILKDIRKQRLDKVLKPDFAQSLENCARYSQASIPPIEDVASLEPQDRDAYCRIEQLTPRVAQLLMDRAIIKQQDHRRRNETVQNSTLSQLKASLVPDPIGDSITRELKEIEAELARLHEDASHVTPSEQDPLILRQNLGHLNVRLDAYDLTT